MSSRKAEIKLTANFERNLASIESFAADEGAPQIYDGLLNGLLEAVIPTLEEFPEIGRSFLAREPGSVEARAIVRRLKTATGIGDIREYVFDDYLLLYALLPNVIYLSIKHHRQLSFDLGAFWRNPRDST